MADQEPRDFFDSMFLRKLETLAIFSRKAFAGRLRGEQRSKRHGASVEFADFRPYSQGDDFRRIDWNAYARFENLFLKLFTEEEDLFLYLLIDSSTSMNFGQPATKFDLARRIAAAMAYIALANLDRVALAALAQPEAGGSGEAALVLATILSEDESGGGADGGQAPAGAASRAMQDHLAFVRGKGSIFSVFDFLRQLRPAGQTDLARSVRDFLLHQRHPGVVVLVSDFLSPSGYEEPLRQLVFARHQPMVIHLLAREELEPDLSGDFRLVDSETGRPVDISTTQRMLEAYRKRVGTFVGGIEQFCKSRDIAYLRSTSDVEFEELILGTLRRAAMVK